MRRPAAAALAGLLALCSSAPAGAAEIVVFSAGAMQSGLERLRPAFQRESGHAVRVTIAVPAALRQRIEAGETPDLVIAPPPVIEALEGAGRLRPEARATLGRVGVAVVVREGAPVPDVSSPGALRQALLDCASLVYNRASTGTHFERVLDAMGIAEAVRAKTTRYPDGFAVMEHVRRGAGYEIGIGPLTEIRPYQGQGIRLVGPLPEAIQNHTSYVAARLAGRPAAESEAAAAFVRYVTSAPARAILAETGVE
jgi:molybdate transport system substrate-binding protein